MKPKTMWICLTDICNNQCLWCYEKGNKSERCKYITRNTVQNIVRTMSEVGVKKCILIGGEPTLHPHLYEIIEDINRFEIPISMVTNGRLLADLDRVKRLKKANINNLVVSVHGWNEITYQKLAGVKKGFTDLKKAIRTLQQEKVRFGINVVLSRYTRGELENIVDFVFRSGLRYVSFNIASPIVSRDGVNAIAVSDMKDYKRQVMTVYRKCKKKGIRTGFLLIMPHCLFTESELSELASTRSITSGCQVLHGLGVVFKTNGAIATCTHLSDFEVANADKSSEILQSAQSFLDFWNSEDLVQVRKKANCYRSEECKNCHMWHECGGGCLVHWAHHEPNIVISNDRMDP